MRESSCRFARNRIETGVDHLTQRGKWKEGGRVSIGGDRSVSAAELTA